MGMSGAAPAIAVRNPGAAVRPFDLRAIPPKLLVREAAPRRTRIWEFNSNLHCSIVGTCLSVGELRQVLRKFDAALEDRTDHELHGVGVTLAGRHDEAAKQLQKALDQRHRLAINQFAKADSEAALRGMWRDSVRRGDIPGAYWATLTHPHCTQAIIREAFGDVHMLSHLVGSANRADLKRLCVLEGEKAALEEKVARQQEALHAAVVSRDRQIEALRQALADRIVSGATDAGPADADALRGLVADRERLLAAEARRRVTLEERCLALQADRDAERVARVAAERRCEALQRELAVVEASLAATPEAGPVRRLDGVALLYVGGRPGQMAAMRALAEGLGAAFLHHDGGVENHVSLLPGLVSRCDLVLFPVDCISHEAAWMVKALCRQAEKRFVPLRSSGVTSLLAVLQEPAESGLDAAAD